MLILLKLHKEAARNVFPCNSDLFESSERKTLRERGRERIFIKDSLISLRRKDNFVKYVKREFTLQSRDFIVENNIYMKTRYEIK